MPEPHVRKSVSKLSCADLERFPVWEFALDEEDVDHDDTTVRPVAVAGELDPSGLLVVRARFQLADGTEMGGYLTPRPDPDPGIDSLQPVIVTARGQLLFWRGVMAPQPDEITDLYRHLGKTSDREVFPLRFSSDVPIAGGPIVGEVHGFVVLEDWRTNKVRIMK